MSQSGIIDVEGSNPQIPTSFPTDNGTAIPLANVLEILGSTVVANTNPTAVETTGSGNTVTIEVAVTQELAAADVTKVGLANFDSTGFDVDADGFVTLTGGGGATTNIDVDAFTLPGTDPVVPLAGNIVMTGAQVASGVVGANVIRTDSVAANTVTIEIQRTTASASPDSSKNGVSHFDSSSFVVDSNGFVALIGAGEAIDSIGTQTGTNPIVPTAAGLVTINGAVVAAGTNPVRSDGTGANTMAIEVQISQALAATDATKIGLSNFDSEQFQVDANGFTQFSDNAAETAIHGWNGCILESAAVTVASDGAIITLSVELGGGGDLTVDFSTGFYDWDTTPAATVTLTAGTDTVPVLSYIYLLESSKVLTASTVGFPAAEHARIATVLCQSAASIVGDGPYKVHAWTDHVVSSIDMGHIADINYWIRQQPATWISGVTQTYTITTNGGSADNVLLTTTSGVVLQLHEHAFPAFSGTPDYYVVNDFVTPYTKVTDLNALLTDSTGASMSGRYFSLVIWGCVSEDTGDCKLFVNLPGGSYSNLNSLLDDVDAFSNYTIPSVFRGTGFLISEWKLRHQAAASGTWTSQDEISLLGLFPSLAAGGSPGGITFTADSGSASPASNNINILGGTSVAGTTPLVTSATGSTVTINAQISQALAATDATKIGLANFDSSSFAVDANGFVTTSSTGIGKTITGDTGGALSPTAGNWNILGGPGVTTTGAGSTLTINSVVFTDTAAATLAVDNGYFATAAGTYDLPATALQGELLIIVCDTAGAVVVDAPALNFIRIGSAITSSGGTATSNAIGDSLTLRYRLATLTWHAVSVTGTWTTA